MHKYYLVKTNYIYFNLFITHHPQYYLDVDTSLGESKAKLEEDKNEIESGDSESSEESKDALEEIEGVGEGMSGTEMMEGLIEKIEKVQELMKDPGKAQMKVNKVIKKALKRINTEEGSFVPGFKGEVLYNSFWQALIKTDYDQICLAYDAYLSTHKLSKFFKNHKNQTKNIKKEYEESRKKSESFKASVDRKLRDLKGVLEEKKLNEEVLGLALENSIVKKVWEKKGVECYFSSSENRELVETTRNQIIKDFIVKACNKSLYHKEFTNKVQIIFEKIYHHQDKVLNIILKQAKIIKKELDQSDQAQSS